MRLSALVFTAIMAAAPTLADTLPLPKAAFSADVTFEASGHQSFGHINIDGVKERRTVKAANAGETTIIIRRDLGKLYRLNARRHVAVEMKTITAAEAGETGAPGANIDTLYGADAKAEGMETIAGIQTTKYHIDMRADSDIKIDTFVWSTDDGIIVRIVGKNPFDNDETPARVELTKILRGPQDPTLFEVPQGTEVISAGVTPGDPPQSDNSIGGATEKPAAR